MGLDPSIILQAQAPQIADPMSMMAKAMQTKQLALQTQQAQRSADDDQAMRDAYKNNTALDASGKAVLNQTGVMSDMMKVNPIKAMDFQKMIQQHGVDELKRQTELGQVLSTQATPENWASVKQQAAQLGMKGAEKLPDTFDPTFVKNWQLHSLSADQMLKHQETGSRMDETREMRDQRLQQAAQDRVDKISTAMKNDFDADRGRAGNFGQISSKVQGADRLNTLINAYKGGDLPKAQMEELALGLSNMLAGQGGAARAQVEALVPHTFWGNVQDAGSYLMNEPRGAGQQKFVEKMADTVNRERQTAMTQLNQIRVQRLPNYETLRKLDPDRYNSLLQSYGIDPANIKNGKYVAPEQPQEKSSFTSAADHPEADQALEFAKKNPNDPRSKAILQRLGK